MAINQKALPGEVGCVRGWGGGRRRGRGKRWDGVLLGWYFKGGISSVGIFKGRNNVT